MLSLTSLTHWTMTAHSLRSDFVHAQRVRDTRPFGSIISLGVPAVFLISVPVAFVSPLAAQLMWAATIVLRGPLRGLAARLSS
jgi:hypothetical protein